MKSQRFITITGHISRPPADVKHHLTVTALSLTYDAQSELVLAQLPSLEE